MASEEQSSNVQNVQMILEKKREIIKNKIEKNNLQEEIALIFPKEKQIEQSGPKDQSVKNKNLNEILENGKRQNEIAQVLGTRLGNFLQTLTPSGQIKTQGIVRPSKYVKSTKYEKRDRSVPRTKRLNSLKSEKETTRTKVDSTYPQKNFNDHVSIKPIMRISSEMPRNDNINSMNFLPSQGHPSSYPPSHPTYDNYYPSPQIFRNDSQDSWYPYKNLLWQNKYYFDPLSLSSRGTGFQYRDPSISGYNNYYPMHQSANNFYKLNQAYDSNPYSQLSGGYPYVYADRNQYRMYANHPSSTLTFISSDVIHK
jgi:hypothetical protein